MTSIEWSNYFPLSMKTAAFQTASYLTDPVCKSHEFFRRFQIVDHLNPTSYRVANWARKCLLSMGFMGCAALAIVTTIPAIALRHISCRLQQEPFIHLDGALKAKTLVEGHFTLFSWNICGTGAGYAISDGGVLPWPFRIDGIIGQIRKQNADIVCLCEVMDVKMGLQIYQALQNDYAHFYLNIGPRTTGVSSGIFVASKFEITNPEFEPFPKEMLVGRTKNAEKGVFAFDIQSGSRVFARVFTTHLQHSEECAFPTKEEEQARRDEMEIIVEKINEVENKVVVLTGDLNLDEPEYAASSWASNFERGEPHEGKTWGGDEFCANLVSKKVSPPLNLDYTMTLKDSVYNIHTTLVPVGYDATKLKPDALSDHLGLYSRIILNS